MRREIACGFLAAAGTLVALGLGATLLAWVGGAIFTLAMAPAVVEGLK